MSSEDRKVNANLDNIQLQEKQNSGHIPTDPKNSFDNPPGEDFKSLTTADQINEAPTEEKAFAEGGKTFDDLLSIIGNVGRFQQLILLIAVLTSVAVACQNVIPVFTQTTPEHRCKMKDLSNDTFTVQNSFHQLLVNRTIPVDSKGKYDECKIYDTTTLNSSMRTQETSSCTEWVYDTSVFSRTLATDLDLVCDNKILRSHSNMLLFAGKFFGAIFQGLAVDKFGRRKVLIVISIGILGTAVGNSLVTNVEGLLALRFLTGMMTTAGYLVAFVLGIEYMGPNYRTLITTVTRAAFALGQLSLTPLAYLIRDWRYLQMSIVWPAVLLVCFIWFAPESSRWLVFKNRKSAAEIIIQKAAKMNKTASKLPQNVTSYLKVNDAHIVAPPHQLFTDPKLLLRWSVIYINWIVIAMVYYGLTLNVSNLSGNIFLNFFCTVMVDIVGTVGTSLLANRISRKYFHASAMLLSGGACAAAFIPVLAGGSNEIVIVLSLVGKLAISSAFFLIYTYTAELFPTVYRGFGMGSSSMMGRIGGIASPYVADLNTYVAGPFGQVLPQLVFGVAGIVGGLLVFLLPNTSGRNLPETIEDAKELT